MTTLIGIGICLLFALPCLLLLALTNAKGGGVQPRGNVNPTPPRPTPPPPQRCGFCRQVLAPGPMQFTLVGREIRPICRECEARIFAATYLARPEPVSAPHGLIPGRPGQEVNSGGDTIIPPLRPDPPRPEDRAYARPEANPRLKDRG